MTSRLIVESPFTTKRIISYGLVVYALDTERWVVVQRRHSAEFIILMRGFYRPAHLPFLVTHITVKEAELLTSCFDGTNFVTIYLQEVANNHKRADMLVGYTKLQENLSTIEYILSYTDLTKNKLQWTWTKGRLQIPKMKESPLDCAKREFLEEAEIVLPPPVYLSDTWYVQTIKTVSGKVLESRYWLYIIANEIPMIPVSQNNMEVADRKWATATEVEQLLNQHSIL